MICLDAHSKLFLMSKYKLDEAYQHLVGLPPCDQGNLKETLCVQCAQRLMNFSRFRDKSLRARALMMELVDKHELITMQHMDIFDEVNNQLKHNIVKTVLDPDHYDLCINNSDTAILTESGTSVEVVAVKREEKNGCISVDADNVQDMSVMEDDDCNRQSDDYEGQTSEPPLIPSCKEKTTELAPVKLEVTLVCTTCMMEFTDEDTYMHHTTMHMEENQNSDEYFPDYGHSSVGAMDGSDDTEPRTQLHPTEDAEDMETNINETMGQTIKIEIEVDPRISDSDSLSDRYVNQNTNICSAELDLPENKKRQKHVNKKPAPSPAGIATNQQNQVRPTNINDDLDVAFENNVDEFINSHKVILNPFESVDSNPTSQLPFACNLCAYRGDTKRDFMEHMKTHMGDKPFQCKLCDYKTTRNDLFMCHMKIHTGEKPFACNFCDYKSSTKSNLVVHMTTHTGEKPFACNLCAYKGAMKRYLMDHMRTHMGDIPFKCKLCDYKTTRHNTLMRHMKTHTGEKPFACNLCDYKSSAKSNLVVHMRAHTGEKPFACNLCDYKYSTKSSLVLHMRTHTGEKPFACNLCDYKSSTKSHLVVHMRAHTGEKPFACNLCDYKYRTQSSLVYHMRTHTGEKPYACDLCNSRFKHKGHLVKHKKTVLCLVR
ncbi:zinc finger protein 37 homolog isoform X2 [Maniola hyperantus]